MPGGRRATPRRCRRETEGSGSARRHYLSQLCRLAAPTRASLSPGGLLVVDRSGQPPLCSPPRGCWRFSPGAERTLLWARQPAVRSRSRVGAGLVLFPGPRPAQRTAIDRTVVECIAGGVQTSVPRWIWFGSASGSGGTAARGEVTSSSVPRTPSLVTVGGTTYAYSCPGKRLTEFTLGWTVERRA